jgi:hypothetical protein
MPSATTVSSAFDVALKDRFAPVAVRGDVAFRTGVFDAQEAEHGAKY